jgi:hypothetical protein
MAGLSESRRIELANAFAGTATRDSTRSLGGVAVRSNRVYFQFRNRCNRKAAVVEGILRRMARVDPDFQKYSLIAKPIAPSPETIDLNRVSTR